MRSGKLLEEMCKCKRETEMEIGGQRQEPQVKIGLSFASNLQTSVKLINSLHLRAFLVKLDLEISVL